MLDLLIVGSGFSGLSLGLAMQRAGRRWRLVEQAERLGGTWRDNRYPGACCDIPSNLYSLAALPNPAWTRLFPPQAEIEAYLNRVADDGGLRPFMEFGARAVSACWNERLACWDLELADGRVHRARALALATGGLSRPQLPAIAGLAQFRGEVFHSARWRHDLPLAGRRVGVVGTGASAIQIAPAIAPEVTRGGGTLTLFQRTPAWILPRGDHRVGARTRERFRRQPWRQTMWRAITYALLEWRAWPFTRQPGLLKQASRKALQHLHAQVADPELRRRLTPSYTMGCKRILISDDFYPALTKPGVQLVDQAVVSATPDGVITADSRAHTLDMLVCATGFQVAGAGAPFELRGIGGRTLNAAWAGGPQAHLGTVVAGFPNLFVMTGPNTGLGHNSMVYIIEAQTRFVVEALNALDARRARAFDARAEVQARYNIDLQHKLARTVWATGGCRSWYLEADGSNRVLWPDFSFRFRQRLAHFDWREFHAIGAAA